MLFSCSKTCSLFANSLFICPPPQIWWSLKDGTRVNPLQCCAFKGFLYKLQDFGTVVEIILYSFDGLTSRVFSYFSTLAGGSGFTMTYMLQPTCWILYTTVIGMSLHVDQTKIHWLPGGQWLSWWPGGTTSSISLFKVPISVLWHYVSMINILGRMACCLILASGWLLWRCQLGGGGKHTLLT